MDLKSLFSSDKSGRVDSGTAYVFERSIQIGDYVVILDNIGSMNVIVGRKQPHLLILSVFIFIFGIFLFNASQNSYGQGNGFAVFIMLLSGVIFAVWLLKEPLSYLRIGACDGFYVMICSTDRKFLVKVREFLREKIDKNSKSSATININSRSITGGIAIGEGSVATGGK